MKFRFQLLATFKLFYSDLQIVQVWSLNYALHSRNVKIYKHNLCIFYWRIICCFFSYSCWSVNFMKWVCKVCNIFLKYLETIFGSNIWEILLLSFLKVQFQLSGLYIYRIYLKNIYTQMWRLTKSKTDMKCDHWTKKWNWSSCKKLALRASWKHGLIAQSVTASERNSVVVGSGHSG